MPVPARTAAAFRPATRVVAATAARGVAATATRADAVAEARATATRCTVPAVRVAPDAVAEARAMATRCTVPAVRVAAAAAIVLLAALSGCASLPPPASACAELFPPTVGSGVYANLRDNPELLAVLAGLLSATDAAGPAGVADIAGASIERLLDDPLVSRIAGIAAYRSGGAAGFCVSGDFPGFVAQWVLGTEFGFREAPADPALTPAYPDHSVWLPGARSPERVASLFGSADFDVRRAVVLAPGLLFVEAELPPNADESDGPGFAPPRSDGTAFWAAFPLDGVGFGIAGAELALYPIPAGAERGRWVMDAAFVLAGPSETVSSRQRGLINALRLFFLSLVREGVLPLTSERLREQAVFAAQDGPGGPGIAVRGIPVDEASLSAAVSVFSSALAR